MTQINSELSSKLRELLALPHETEWVEFKQNHADEQEIGEYISALSNSAGLHQKEAGYLIWGVDDNDHHIVGTSFKPRQHKVGNQELESWLALQLSPRIDFKIHELTYDHHLVVVFEIQPCQDVPVRFKNDAFIRIGSYKKKLKEFPEKERTIWTHFNRIPFERGCALKDRTDDAVLSLIDYPAYFELIGQNLPANKAGIIERLKLEKIILPGRDDHYEITNLGALLFAKRLSDFEGLSRKAVRVIFYKANHRIEAISEKVFDQGYAAGFTSLIAYINDRLPHNEYIGQALRKEVKMYPEIAIRELVANALIHQDLAVTGDSPLVEIFTDRIEITNSGKPLINPLRFIDEPPQSRNEALASFMRRLNICEERGSGIDKVVFQIELYQLPAPNFLVTQNHTKTVLFAFRKLSEMSSEDRLRACYQHACLRYVSNQEMTNTSLRERFSIDEKNYSIASRIIAETVQAGLIKRYDPTSSSRKHSKYVPFWA